MTLNPPPHKRQALPQVVRYNLLGYANQKCQVSVVINNKDADNREHFLPLKS